MIIIVGGGIVGAGIAYFLSEAGVSGITLIEKEKLLGMGVTQYCSGGIRSQFSTPINVAFSKEALKYLCQQEIGFKPLGYLILDTEKDSLPRVKMQNEMGVPSEYLKPEAIRARFPYIRTEGIKSASFYARDGIADPSQLLSIYEKAARSQGVKFLTEVEVTSLIKEGNRVKGVKTASGEMRADRVILAAGVGSQQLAATIGLEIPLVKRRKYVLVVDGFDFDFPLTMEIPLGWYIKKEGADCLLGMSGKAEQQEYEKKEEAVAETVEASFARFPLTEKCGIKKVISSLSDETPDKHAIIDRSIPGLIIATGFSGHGFMHSPATGRAVTAWVKGEKPVIEVSELRLGRQHIKEPLAI